MDLEAFKETILKGKTPDGLSPPLAALWAEARGEWDKAHRFVQEEGDRRAAWVHAYLHRKKGDEANAAYWYARAGRSASELSFEQEWAEIATALLNDG